MAHRQLTFHFAKPWLATTGPLMVRLGLHTGESQEREENYCGTDFCLTACVMGLGYGGLLLLSEATAAFVKEILPRQSIKEKC